MTNRDKKLIRNRTAGFLIFTAQAGKQMHGTPLFTGPMPPLVPATLECIFEPGVASHA